MPKYDAFGREIEEGTRASPQPSDAAPARSPVSEPTPSGRVRSHDRRPRRVRARGPRPRVISRLILLIVVVVAGANLAGGIAGRVKDAVDDLPTLTPPTPTPSAANPVGLQKGSMIRADAFRRALADLRGRELGRVQTLRLAPERIDASLLTRRTTLVNVQLRHDGSFQRFSESGPGFGQVDTIAFARLDPSAPQRLVRAAAERLHRSAARIDYLVPSITLGKVTWGAYFKGGEIFLADARGHITRRIS